ncbi:MAG: protein-tyrosine phosphatase [Hyphomicrobiaceae bacterium]|jgi:protein-tyrosine phosphatase
MPGRHIELEGAWNFRDFGGIATGDGHQIQPGYVFRSDALHGLTVADSGRLDLLGIERVFDLRSVREVEGDGLGEFASAGDRHRHRPLVAVTLSPFDPSIDWKSLDLSERYAQMLAEGGAVVAEILTWLARPESGPTVFHCTAGKDRTGVVAALLLLALGVGSDEIVEDYAISEHHLGRLLVDRRGPLIESGLDMNAVAYLTTAPAERMEAMLQRIASQWGGADAYLHGCGVSDDVVADLRDRLLT